MNVHVLNFLTILWSWRIDSYPRCVNGSTSLSEEFILTWCQTVAGRVGPGKDGEGLAGWPLVPNPIIWASHLFLLKWAGAQTTSCLSWVSTIKFSGVGILQWGTVVGVGDRSQTLITIQTPCCVVPASLPSPISSTVWGWHPTPVGLLDAQHHCVALVCLCER